jgi:hypothetical protein
MVFDLPPEDEFRSAHESPGLARKYSERKKAGVVSAGF